MEIIEKIDVFLNCLEEKIKQDYFELEQIKLLKDNKESDYIHSYTLLEKYESEYDRYKNSYINLYHNINFNFIGCCFIFLITIYYAISNFILLIPLILISLISPVLNIFSYIKEVKIIRKKYTKTQLENIIFSLKNNMTKQKEDYYKLIKKYNLKIQIIEKRKKQYFELKSDKMFFENILLLSNYCGKKVLLEETEQRKEKVMKKIM